MVGPSRAWCGTMTRRDFPTRLKSKFTAGTRKCTRFSQGVQYANGTSGMTANNLPFTMDLTESSELLRCTMQRLESSLIGCLDPCRLACCPNGPRVHHNWLKNRCLGG